MQPQIAEIRAGISRRDKISVTLRNYRRNGQLFWNELCLAPAGHGSAGPTHYIGLMHDVTNSKETAERLHQTLETDRLTGVLNRYAFYDQVVRLASDPSAILLVIKIDIAYFHDINTGFGYEVGDNVLRQIADRLNGVSAAAVGRLNAGEFGIACRLASRDDADAALAEVSAALAPRYVVPGAVVSVRFAVGYTVGEPGADAITLIRRAGAALKESRLTKLREVRRFDEAAEARSRDRIRLTNDLQQALVHEEFNFAYQPKVDLATGVPVGAEALLRWNHGLFGEQRPDRFINVAEDTGIILDIGAWGLRSVVAFASRINRDRIQPLTFAVNVSTVEFIHRDMVRFTADVLERSGVDPRWLIFELTESLMAESSPKLLQIFKSLRDLGVGLAIDDFGTGYASLRYLEAFPVTEVKLDRSFVQGICHSHAKHLIVDSVIRLGRELGINVVAEGVETAAERSMLLKWAAFRPRVTFLADRLHPKPLPPWFATVHRLARR